MTRSLAWLGAVSLALAACSAGDADDEAGSASNGDSASVRVTLSDTAIQAAGIRVEVVTAVEVAGTTALEVPGQLAFDSSRIAVVSPRAPGRLDRMIAVPGQAVGAGEPVAYLTSPDFLAAQADLAQAARRVNLLQGSSDEAGARAILVAARQRLLLLGATEAEVDQVQAGGETGLALAVRAPFEGTILEALAQAGIAVESGSPIYRMVDARVLHLIAQVPEGSLVSVRAGMPAVISVPAYPTLRFAGQVIRILGQLDPETRTARVVVNVPNPGRALMAGMFGTARIEGASVSLPPAPAILVPTEAVLTDGAERFVFVETQPGTFEKRVVQITAAPPGAAPNARLVVSSGLFAGDRLVVQGAFVLRSELAKAKLVDDG